ncbi:MAG: hypothetical protein H6813_05240 [Phycisphaeraceae bacterium]|nr:hypothetical protein [Phycisphaeraceae bacterium]MCB9847788.1 hypothetical protein [Phycisphaeraceae bacterium]
MNSPRTFFRMLTVLGVAGAFAAQAPAQTITVDTSSLVTDFTGARTVADLPGPDGKVSLLEAGIASDNTPGVQTIAFDVPQAEWEFQWLYPGRLVLHPTVFRVFEPVILDGTTQTASTGDTNPDGCEVVIWASMYVLGDGSTVTGFDSVPLNVTGSNCLIENITGLSSISLFGGSGSLVRNNNIASTIKIDRSNDNVVVGNTCQRVRVLGFISEFGTGPITNTRIGGPTLEERNYITGYGTWDGEGFPSGTTVQLFDTQGTIVENNWIGVTPDGLAQGNLASTVGVGFEHENHDVVIRDNLIAGILGHGTGPHAAGLLFGWGVLVSGAGTNIDIVGNTIGLDANGDPLLGSVYGVDVGTPVTNPSSVVGVTIGGQLPGEGNTIAGHLFNGVTVGDDALPVRISGNAIHDNNGIGIDLVPSSFGFGVSPNDAFDADTGGNGVQNFPDLESATLNGALLNVIGTLHSSSLDDFTLEFFASPACDDSGFGQGQVYLGTADVTTDSQGDASFDVNIPAVVAEGWVITATATLEPTGETSEFSFCAAMTLGESGKSADLNGDGIVDTADLGMMVGMFGTAEPIADLNSDGVVDTADLGALLAAFGTAG